MLEVKKGILGIFLVCFRNLIGNFFLNIYFVILFIIVFISYEIFMRLEMYYFVLIFWSGFYKCIDILFG